MVLEKNTRNQLKNVFSWEEKGTDSKGVEVESCLKFLKRRVFCNKGEAGEGVISASKNVRLSKDKGGKESPAL